jgi:hypothetical protein
MNGAMKLLVVLALVAACRSPRADLDYGGARYERCDPHGPMHPPSSERLTRDLEAYVQRELFADEKAVRERCQLEEVDDIEDDALMTRCASFAPKRVPAAAVEACRRTCLITGRAKVAVLVHDRIVRSIESGFRFEACEPAAGVTRGDAAARLWACSGHSPVPRRMQLQFIFAADATNPTVLRLERVIVDGPLVPNQGVFAFTYGKTDHGCGHTAASTEVHWPERQ